jgi:TraX protein
MSFQSARPVHFTIPALPKLSGGAQDALKLTALGLMLLDHTNKVVLHESTPALSWIARLAFPLFAFLIAYNLEVRRVNPRRYFVPLLICGLISQPFYILAFHNSFADIFFTLILGVGLWSTQRTLEKRGYGWAVWLAALPFVAVNVWTEYALFGCLIIPIWAALLRNSSDLMMWFTWGFVTLGLNGFMPESFVALLAPLVVLAASRVLRNHPRLFTRERFLAYGFYPVHLIVLVVARYALK